MQGMRGALVGCTQAASVEEGNAADLLLSFLLLPLPT